jgi:hypothetical protein
MSQRWVKVSIIMAFTVLLGFLVWSWMSDKGFQWIEFYDNDVKEPYGGYVLAEMMSKGRDSLSFQVIEDTIYTNIDLEQIPVNSNYVFLGRRLYLDSAETRFLLDFVKRGNKAFVMSSRLNIGLLDSLLAVDMYGMEWSESWSAGIDKLSSMPDTLISASIVHETTLEPSSSFDCLWVSNHKPNIHHWTYFNHSIEAVDQGSLHHIGYFNDEYLNYVKVPWGEGYFYLHTNPELFTNYNLINTPKEHLLNWVVDQYIGMKTIETTNGFLREMASLIFTHPTKVRFPLFSTNPPCSGLGISY